MHGEPNQVHDTMNQNRIPTVSILIPTLNEADNIAPLLARTLAVIENNGLAAEVLVVDGGSKDGTQDGVQQWTAGHPVRLIQSDAKQGLAGDIIAAADSARGEFVVVLDADLSHPPEMIPQIVRPLLDGTYNMAVASRYARGGSMLDWPWSRWLVSRVATMLVTPLVSVKDPLSGFFAVRREILLKRARGMSGFKIKSGFRQVQIRYSPGANFSVATRRSFRRHSPSWVRSASRRFRPIGFAPGSFFVPDPSRYAGEPDLLPNRQLFRRDTWLLRIGRPQGLHDLRQIKRDFAVAPLWTICHGIPARAFASQRDFLDGHRKLAMGRRRRYHERGIDLSRIAFRRCRPVCV
ncbi:MAG: glycosyltransferase [Deltaproteobacteria bacterium]|nr:MAG: glycosyltransferase [Deltaproteobacteria bacterium]